MSANACVIVLDTYS